MPYQRARIELLAGDTVYGSPHWSYCRALLLSRMRGVILTLGENLDTITRYSLHITPTCLDLTSPVTPAQRVSEANELVSNIIPGISEPVLEVKTSRGDTFIDQQLETTFQLCPEIPQYGWAINGLMMGYLRGMCWAGRDDETHQFDIENQDQRLKLWWKNAWATDPRVTWYPKGSMGMEEAALGSIFNTRRDRPDITYIGRWITGPIATFCEALVDNGLAGDTLNPSFNDGDY